MVFSTYSFLFLFFPLAFFIYHPLRIATERVSFLKKIQLDSIVLLLISLVFYGWAEIRTLPFILLIAFLVRLGGKRIHRLGEKASVFALGSGILLAVLLIGIKSFHMVNLRLAQHFGPDRIPVIDLIVPLGVSYLAFSSISYLADCRKEDPGSFVDCFLYLFFFPKVVSGPIVKWREFSQGRQTPDAAAVRKGLGRIIIGMAKKLLIADRIAWLIYSMQHYNIGGLDTASAWILCFAYYLQIYFDFSAYSDIAVGLGGCFGYGLKENFDHPYVSCSVSEFWRRWHISLGAWFKEYLYIPLGGNRKGSLRTCRNLFLVFAACGVWHGVGVGYLIWGCMHGVLVVTERLLEKKAVFKKIPVFFGYLYTQFFVMLGWLFFLFNSAGGAVAHLKQMLGMGGQGQVVLKWNYFVRGSQAALLVLAFILALLPGLPAYERFRSRFKENKGLLVAGAALLLLLFVASIAAMANNGYSPFIYFQY